MNIDRILKMGGYPNTPEGIKAFYDEYPTEDSFKKAFGGVAFPQAPTADKFFSNTYRPNSPRGFYAEGGDTEGDPDAGQLTNEQIQAIRDEYNEMTGPALRKEMVRISDALQEPELQNDPSLIVRRGVLSEMLGGAEGAKAGDIRQYYSKFPYKPLAPNYVRMSREGDSFEYRTLPRKQNVMEEIPTFDYRMLPPNRNVMEEMNVPDVPFDPSMMAYGGHPMFNPGGPTPPPEKYVSPYQRYAPGAAMMEGTYIDPRDIKNRKNYINDILNNTANMYEYANKVKGDQAKYNQRYFGPVPTYDESMKNKVGYEESFKKMPTVPLKGYKDVYQRGNTFYALEPASYDPKMLDFHTIKDPRIKEPVAPKTEPTPAPVSAPQKQGFDPTGWTKYGDMEAHNFSSSPRKGLEYYREYSGVPGRFNNYYRLSKDPNAQNIQPNDKEIVEHYQQQRSNFPSYEAQEEYLRNQREEYLRRNPNPYKVANKRMGGGLPGGANEMDMPCYECGGSMEYGGTNSSAFGYGQFPNVMGDGGEDYASGGWIKKVSKGMEKRGTKGSFTKYCGGKVTDECIQRGLNSSNPKTRKRAALAKAFRSMSKKAEGGDAGYGLDPDSVGQDRARYFMDILNRNRDNANMDGMIQEAEQYDDYMNAYPTPVAQYGKQTTMRYPGDFNSFNDVNPNDTSGAWNAYNDANAMKNDVFGGFKDLTKAIGMGALYGRDEFIPKKAQSQVLNGPGDVPEMPKIPDMPTAQDGLAFSEELEGAPFDPRNPFRNRVPNNPNISNRNNLEYENMDPIRITDVNQDQYRNEPMGDEGTKSGFNAFRDMPKAFKQGMSNIKKQQRRDKLKKFFGFNKGNENVQGQGQGDPSRGLTVTYGPVGMGKFKSMNEAYAAPQDVLYSKRTTKRGIIPWNRTATYEYWHTPSKQGTTATDNKTTTDTKTTTTDTKTQNQDTKTNQGSQDNQNNQGSRSSYLPTHFSYPSWKMNPTPLIRPSDAFNRMRAYGGDVYDYDQNGGQYMDDYYTQDYMEDGGEYEDYMTDEQIQDLIRQGIQVEYLD